VRTFETGATRDSDENKPDYEGFLSPLVIKEFGNYMLAHQTQADGSKRASDNWQKGIPVDEYMKSMWRHFFSVWDTHRAGWDQTQMQRENLCALLFNVQGMLHELLKADARQPLITFTSLTQEK